VIPAAPPRHPEKIQLSVPRCPQRVLVPSKPLPHGAGRGGERRRGEQFVGGEKASTSSPQSPPPCPWLITMSAVHQSVESVSGYASVSVGVKDGEKKKEWLNKL